MPTTSRAAAAACLILLTSACAPVLAKTPVRGPSTAIVQLAGEWEGTYSGAESGRIGTIVFRLRAGADTAEGDVLMTPRRLLEGNEAAAREGVSPALGATAELLTIRFVRVNGNEISGVLDPYRDPDCGCKLRTTFVGFMLGDTIEGTFHSEGDGIHHLPANGQWKVKRLR